MRVTALFNPGAGRGRARGKIDQVLRHLETRGAEVELLTSRDPEHLTSLAREASHDGADRIVLCGGDGSLNLAIRELDLSRTTLGIIPLGSGDDFAQALGLPRETHAACDVIFDGRPREVDVALVNGRRFVGVAGLGFDSQVAREANRVKRLRGSLVYFYAIFRVLPGFRPHQVSVTVDGVQRDEELMFVVVGNSTRYGAGVHIVPSALLDDGMLDMVLVRRSTIFNLLTTLPMAYRGTHVRRPYVITERGRKFHFESVEELEIYADGEHLATTPATIELASERLRVMVPQR
ncbi:MAG TPA: diacylglycerol kinase family protein [Thermoanaerobaculia bacterium]|nr:diacylglycerol kinase family protein [Thermoanaerobaculia bacterium]